MGRVLVPFPEYRASWSHTYKEEKLVLGHPLYTQTPHSAPTPHYYTLTLALASSWTHSRHETTYLSPHCSFYSQSKTSNSLRKASSHPEALDRQLSVQIRAHCSMRQLTPTLLMLALFQKQNSKPKWIFSNIFTSGSKRKRKASDSVKGKLFRGVNRHFMMPAPCILHSFHPSKPTGFKRGEEKRKVVLFPLSLPSTPYNV